MRSPLARLAACALAPLGLAQASPGEDPDGPALFASRCATCHGQDGRGGPGRELFVLEMPDFTDCRFAAREADADWLAVIQGGGPARGFSPIMPAHGTLLSKDEIRAVLGHLRSLCSDARWPRGELNLPRPLATEKAFPEDEAVAELFADVEGDGLVATELLYEQRIGRRSQIELALPIAARQAPGPSGSWNVGVGDVGIGVKHAFFADLSRGSIAALGGEVRLPTGDKGDGLGTGTVVFEPYVAAGQILPADGFLQLQVLGEIPVDSDVATEVQLRTALGASLTPFRSGRTITPMVEAIGTWELGQPVADDWDLLPQVQVTLSQRQHVRLDLGARIPLTHTSSRSTRIGAYLLWDWFDGSLLAGW